MTVIQFHRNWSQYVPKTKIRADDGLPTSLKGLGLVDGVHKYYRDNYEEVYQNLSPQDKPLYSRHVAKVRLVAKQIAAFTSKNLSDRRNVEEAVALACVALACDYLNSFSRNKNVCDVETSTISGFATYWSKNIRAIGNNA